ncbi:type III secretion system export apparatus subunit SctT [Chromobacterium piscinae]|uniref:Type III secretion system export apparatus subunit SctT n=1 Tax=Chromobacterium piscinae TaxID=686831 RepID=A0ABV0H9S2_9NEIS
MDFVSLFFNVQDALLAAVLGFARVAPTFFMLPFLNGSVLSGVMRITITMLVALSLWPYPAAALPPWSETTYFVVVVQEVFIGLVLAVVLVLPFWIFHAIGNIIDNQRGASMGSNVDPASGDETTDMGNLLHWFAAVVYLQTGGLVLLLETFSMSYQICGPWQTCTPTVKAVVGVLNKTVAQALILSGPVIAALLLSEVLLGLLGRFAQQMNPFSLSLGLKSAIAIFVLFVYFSPILPGKVWSATVAPAALVQWLTRN